MILSDDWTTKGALLNTHGEEQAAAWTRFLARSVRSALYVPAIVLAVALLFIIVVLGAIVFLVYRDRSPGDSYSPPPHRRAVNYQSMNSGVSRLR
jgi:hypothetical protein